jgi:hypothetical protein
MHGPIVAAVALFVCAVIGEAVLEPTSLAMSTHSNVLATKEMQSKKQLQARKKQANAPSKKRAAKNPPRNTQVEAPRLPPNLGSGLGIGIY